MKESPLFCIFSVAGLFFAISVHTVQEVIRHLEVTRMPLAPTTVSGLINLRGQIIPAIDARRCLDLEDRPAAQPGIHLILRTGDGLVSLLVDDIGSVMEFAEADYESRPATLQGKLRHLVCGAYKLPGKLLLVLDLDRLLAGISGEPPIETLGQGRVPSGTEYGSLNV